MLACFVSMTRLDHFTREGTLYLSFLFIAFGAYGVICWRVINKPEIPLVLIALGAILFRLPLLTTTPTLSTDIWRYIWDGRLINQGVNPYQYSVDAPELFDLRTELHSRIEHQELASPYPPAAQGVFALSYAVVPENPLVLQIVFTVFDLMTGLLLFQLLRLLARPPAWVLLYAWNPVIVVEFAHGAHVDSLMTFLILLALYFTFKQRHASSAFALALATLAKFIPALLLPIFIRRWGLKRSILYGLVVALAFVPFLSAGISEDGTGILGAAQVYAREWKTNDGLFDWLVNGLQPYTAEPIQMARLLVLGMLMIGTGAVFAYEWCHHATGDQKAQQQRVVTEAVLLISLYLLLIYVMFPWYLTWVLAMIPLLPLHKHRGARWWAAGWFYFSAAVNLSYLFYLDPANPREYLWVRLVEYVPLYILLGIASLHTLLPVLLERLRQPKQQHEGTPQGK